MRYKGLSHYLNYWLPFPNLGCGLLEHPWMSVDQVDQASYLKMNFQQGVLILPDFHRQCVLMSLTHLYWVLLKSEVQILCHPLLK